MKLDRRLVRLLLAVAAAIVAWLLDLTPPTSDRSPSGVGGTTEVVRAIEQRRSNQWIETEAVVTRPLADDTRGSRHQRILVDIAGRSVLIAHNIDLAERVPVERGDRIRVRGEFEWNDKGGVIHWTHRDPDGRRRGGWIEHGGRRFD
jgi:hypothetical protein